MPARLFFLFILIWSLTTNAQVYPAGFIKPMDLPFNLAGSFGEPRPDHFHSGIDIKTNEEEGYAVVAVGDGYVSRIRVSPYGYGKAVYIAHPNGYTSVYGHLSGFNAKLEKYVHQQHYQKQQAELDLYPAAGALKVRQGDTIAFSGNTGGSSGPHLHFEIRDSKTEHALNPLDFYPKDFYADTIPPQLNKLKVYQFQNGFYSSYTTIQKLNKRDDQYSARPVILSNDSIFCISLEGFDKQDGSENKNGIYSMKMTVNGQTEFQYSIDAVNFDQTRMCNAFADYQEMMHGNGYFYNCYRLKNNTLPIYANDKNGMIRINNHDTLYITVDCYDYTKNLSRVSFPVIRIDEEPAMELAAIQAAVASKEIRFHKRDSLQLGKFKIHIPANTFYDDLRLDLTELNAETYTLGSTSTVPLQKPVKIELNSAIHKNRGKVVIIRVDTKAREIPLKTSFDNNKFYAETKELGTFYLKFDTLQPMISDVRIGENTMQAAIRDELSGVSSYQGYIDGQWVNFYYDAKNDRITYTYDEYCPPGEHNLKLVVTDAVGNSAIFTQKFKR